MTGSTGVYILFNFATQLSVIGQLTSSCIISDLVRKEQPIKTQYFNMGNNNEFSRVGDKRVTRL